MLWVCAGNHLGATEFEGRSELGTRRFVAQGQEIKAIKGECHSPHKKRKKKSFFAYFFAVEGTNVLAGAQPLLRGPSCLIQ